MADKVYCKYCRSKGCTNTYFGEAPGPCVHPLTPNDEITFDTAEQIYQTSFAQNVNYGHLAELFQLELNPPRTTPPVTHLTSPCANYLFHAILELTIDPVRKELIPAAFCRLLVFKAALHFSSRLPQLASFNRSQSSGDTFTLMDDFFVSFTDIAVNCNAARLYMGEQYLMFAMLALHRDTEEMRDTRRLLLALEHYEFELYCSSGRFNVDAVKEIVKKVQRLVRVYGPRTLLSPVHANPHLSPANVLALARLLYAYHVPSIEL